MTSKRYVRAASADDAIWSVAHHHDNVFEFKGAANDYVDPESPWFPVYKVSVENVGCVPDTFDTWWALNYYPLVYDTPSIQPSTIATEELDLTFNQRSLTHIYARVQAKDRDDVIPTLIESAKEHMKIDIAPYFEHVNGDTSVEYLT
jgi:hypothetical protein